jgi:hypothetical protein
MKLDRTGSISSPRIIPVGGEPPPMDSMPAPSLNGRQRSQREGDKTKKKRASAGRFQCINAFLDATMAKLTPAERSVWLILWRDTKPSGLAGTSQISMARRAGVSDRSIRTALRGLEQKGLITVVHRGNLRRGASIYRVHQLNRDFSLSEVRFRLSAEVGFRSLRKYGSGSPRRDRKCVPLSVEA